MEEKRGRGEEGAFEVERRMEHGGGCMLGSYQVEFINFIITALWAIEPPPYLI